MSDLASSRPYPDEPARHASGDPCLDDPVRNRATEPRGTEPRTSARRNGEPRPPEPRQPEPRHRTAPRHAEPRHAEPRHAEPAGNPLGAVPHAGEWWSGEPWRAEQIEQFGVDPLAEVIAELIERRDQPDHPAEPHRSEQQRHHHEARDTHWNDPPGDHRSEPHQYWNEPDHDDPRDADLSESSAGAGANRADMTGEAEGDSEPTAHSIAALLAAPGTSAAELADAVAWCYDDAALPLLLPLAHHTDARVRRAVAQALPSVLGEAVPDETVQALLVLSNDRDDDVRDWACFALGTQLSEVDVPALRDALVARLDDLHDDTRCEALLGLARRRDERILPVLHERLSRDNVFSLEIDAAGALGHPSLHTLVRGHLSGWDDDVVARVCAALRLTDPDGVGEDLLDGLAEWFSGGAPHATDEDRYWWSVTLQLLEHAEYRAPEIAELVHARLAGEPGATTLMLGSRLAQLAGDHGWWRWTPAC